MVGHHATSWSKPWRLPRHFLEQAVAVTTPIAGYALPDSLLEALAREYALTGDYQRAYETALAANEARARKYSKEVQQRVVLMQMRVNASGDLGFSSLPA
jgi:hypothetical protein